MSNCMYKVFCCQGHYENRKHINFGSKICDNLQNQLQVKGNQSFPVRFKKRAMLFFSLIAFSW